MSRSTARPQSSARPRFKRPYVFETEHKSNRTPDVVSREYVSISRPKRPQSAISSKNRAKMYNDVGKVNDDLDDREIDEAFLNIRASLITISNSGSDAINDGSPLITKRDLLAHKNLKQNDVFQGKIKTGRVILNDLRPLNHITHGDMNDDDDNDQINLLSPRVTSLQQGKNLSPHLRNPKGAQLLYDMGLFGEDSVTIGVKVDPPRSPVPLIGGLLEEVDSSYNLHAVIDASHHHSVMEEEDTGDNGTTNNTFKDKNVPLNASNDIKQEVLEAGGNHAKSTSIFEDGDTDIMPSPRATTPSDTTGAGVDPGVSTSAVNGGGGNLSSDDSNKRLTRMTSFQNLLQKHIVTRNASQQNLSNSNNSNSADRHEQHNTNTNPSISSGGTVSAPVRLSSISGVVMTLRPVYTRQRSKGLNVSREDIPDLLHNLSQTSLATTEKPANATAEEIDNAQKQQIEQQNKLWGHLRDMVDTYDVRMSLSNVVLKNEIGRGKFASVHAGRLDFNPPDIALKLKSSKWKQAKGNTKDFSVPLNTSFGSLSSMRMSIPVVLKASEYRNAPKLVYGITNVSSSMDGSPYVSKDRSETSVGDDSEDMVVPPIVSIKEFMREITALKSLKHRNIVMLLGVIIAPRLGVVLEHLEGGALVGLLNGSKTTDGACKILLSPAARYQILSDVASGLAYIHSNNFIHRDLKSHNVLISFGYGGLIAKIADFGTAVPCDMHTILSEQVGTSGYTAPEVFYPGQYTKSADVFSFGMLQWETLNISLVGKDRVNPLCGKDPYDCVDMITQGVRPSLTPHCVHHFMHPLLEECWATEPFKRPTMDAVARYYLDNTSMR